MKTYNDGYETVSDGCQNVINVKIDESDEVKSCEVGFDVEKDKPNAFIHYQKFVEMGISNKINDLER
ncbi:hypothetical protein F8M41_006277 [Gigaspora margarita]|uniref:Uncharacterized protein n=1 Tax=Gigaspora margarita TaxID=4874 RepID=A0A8H4A4A0_GIGMA|nr:hypothetical protein F8M41_006277 [Gigaspora margarita]